ncbi:MAG: hypothetical protein JSS50_02095 [Proteobacteria bacterium]|nr:hypothetical protein [Pseudomonadota bacterium]
MAEISGSDIAMQNFTQNILRGMGTGSSIGGSSEFALIKDVDYWEVAKQGKKLMPTLPTYGTVGKLLEGMEGTINTLNVASAMMIFSPPVPINAGKKIPGVVNKRAGG